jgi:hypothetical protein
LINTNICTLYVGQSGRAISVRFKEHMRYIRSNNSTSAYAAHILDNRHEYGTKEDTLKLLKKCQKGKIWIVGKPYICGHSTKRKY